MAFGYKTNAAWSTQQQLWILAQVSEGRLQRDIYDEFTAKEPSPRPEDGIERWKGNYGAFRQRLWRLTKNGIDPAIDTDTGQKFEFDLADARGRYDYWVYLARTTTDQRTRISALQMIEKLAPQFFGNPSDEKTLLTNPRNIKLNVAYVSELLMICRLDEAVGGLHNLDFGDLCIGELKKLIQAILIEYKTKMAAQGKSVKVEELINAAVRKESNEESVMRLKSEIWEWRRIVNALPAKDKNDVITYVEGEDEADEN